MGWRGSVKRRVAVACAIATSLSGCSFFETPFSLSLDDIDEGGDERLAVITIGDPQVYARETLINDRRREIVFLTKQIDGAEAKKFTPQIARDLQTLSALRLALGVNVDPLAGKRTQMLGRRDELAQERELLQLQQEIEYEKRKLDNIRAASADQPPASGQEPTPATAPQVSAEQLVASIEKLRTDLAALKGSLPGKATVDVLGSETFTVTPMDEFRDRQAYRAELRAALQAVNLDDIHDFGGNTLYRLQFQASLFPGENKAKFGAAQLTLERPVLTREEVNELFYAWVSHAARKMNPYMAADYRFERYTTRDYYKQLGPAAGLFSTVCTDESDKAFCVPLPVDTKIGTGFIGTIPRGVCTKEKRSVSGIAASVAMINAALSQLDSSKVKSAHPNFWTWYEVLRKRANEESCTDALTPPDAFLDLVLDHGGCTNTCPLSGRAYAYATTPVELGQRVSTTASAARSFELALAAAATFAESGVDVKGGMNLARVSQGQIQALERVPLTLGYSSRNPSNEKPYLAAEADTQQIAKPEFGWVFGPAVRVDAEKNRLRLSQIPRAETLTADLSVPAWWPHAKLNVRTAWIANWHAGTTVMSSTGTANDAIFVALPKKSADLDLLTSKLAKGTNWTGASRRPYIDDISPRSVSACAGTVTLLIKGPNIWRSTEVYLGTMKAAADKIEVLPDMEGVSVQFDLNNLFTRPIDSRPSPGVVDVPAAGTSSTRHLETDRKVSLTVATRSGVAEYEVGLLAPSNTATADCSKSWVGAGRY